MVDEEGMKIIEIQLPNDEIAIAELKSGLGTILETVTEDEKDTKCREIINASCTSTALREGIRGLLDSKPGSQFAQDFESVSGLSNEHGRESTLLAEGIAYAIQGIYAPDVQPLGSLAPVSGEGERADVIVRKKLGETLRPKVKEYLEAGKNLDGGFLSFASEEIMKLGKLPAEATPNIDSKDRTRAEQYWQEKLSGETLISEPQDPKCQISVVVPIFNEEKANVFRQLKSILKQREINSEEFEVIYVVNNSPEAGEEIRNANREILSLPIWKNRPVGIEDNSLSEEERELVEELRNLNLFVIDKSTPGNEIVKCNVAKARNRALAEASKRFDINNKNGIILQTDADTFYDDPTFFNRVIKKFSNNPDLIAIPGGAKLAYVTNEQDPMKREAEIRELNRVVDYMGWESLKQIVLKQPWGLDDMTMWPGNGVYRSFESAVVGGMQDATHMDDNSLGLRLYDLAESHGRSYSYKGANNEFSNKTIIRQKGGITTSLDAIAIPDMLPDPFIDDDSPDKGRLFPIKHLYRKYLNKAAAINMEATTKLQETISSVDIIYEAKPQDHIQ